MGYSTYAPTKWALRGLADVLRNELGGLGISVHMAYPPDTETPARSCRWPVRLPSKGGYRACARPSATTLESRPWP